MLQMLVPGNLVFPGSWGYARKWLVIHKTAGFHSAQDVAAYFQSGSNGLGVSSHYVIGQDGLVVQCVDEQDGAGANCCLTTGHDSFWPQGINENLVTFSIEHVDPAIDNSTPVTDAQKAASFALIRGICERWNIPMRPADSNGGITGHYSLDPVNRARCPGNYPWTELWDYLGGNAMLVPQGWNDDGTTLSAPNGHNVIRGFRDYILSHQWDPGNMPLENEQGVQQVELHASTGPGTRQLFRDCLLIWTAKNGVHTSAAGAEIAASYTQIAAQRVQLGLLQAKLDAAQIPANVDISKAIAALATINTGAAAVVATIPALKQALGVQ